MTLSFKTMVGSRKKDGTYPLYVRVTLKGRSRKLRTSMYATDGDLSRSRRIKSADLQRKMDDLIRRMRDAASALSPFDLEDMDVDGVVRFVRRRMTGTSFRLDFFEFGDKYIEAKTEGSRPAYRQALNSLERFLGRRRLDINDITKGLLSDFVAFIDAEPKMQYNGRSGKWVRTGREKIARAASSRHLMKLGHIFDAARRRYNDEDEGEIAIPRTPFASMEKVRPLPQGQRNLGTELMQRIILAEPEDRRLLEALALFVVSFALMGANVADLWEAESVEGRWRYRRKKTRTRRADGAEIEAEIPGELSPFIARLQDGPEGWFLPALHRLKDANTVTSMVNRHLRAWCESEGIPVFTFYAARHSWASIARSEGVEKATIDDALGHRGQWDVTDIYAERAWGLVHDAARKVVGLFRWPGVLQKPEE